MSRLMSKLLVVVAIICASCPVYSATRYVSLDGGHDTAGGYASWAGAATSINDAVSIALPGEIILVSNGLYKLTNQISLGANILRSWNNGATDRDGTIIDGNFYEGKPVTNRCVEIVGSGAMVDGFTISNGCVKSYGGAGVFVRADADYAIITNCCIVQNTNTVTVASSGAGVRMHGANGILTHCLILSNSAPMSGDAGAGGVYLSGSNNLMEFCEVGWNQAQSAAGVILSAGNRASNCRIYGNSAGSWGGGFYLNASNAVLERCIVSNNFAGAALGGGAAYLRYGIVRNCILVVNRTSGTHGGGIYVNNPISDLTIESCLFANNIASNNSAAYGGGIAIQHANSSFTGNVQVLNCTFTGNWGRDGNGGGIWMAVSAANADKVAIKNTIAAGNKIWTLDRDIDAVGSGGSSAGTNCFAFCCSPTFNSFPPEQGNQMADPLFVSEHDYRLQKTSPCVNVGTNLAWMANAVDLAGLTRIDRFFCQVDMGCYEYLSQGMVFNLR